jgi:hypothetical protein
VSRSVSGGRSSGPFTITAPNLSFGPSCFGIPSSKAHLPKWARFRARAHRPVSGQLYEPTSGGLIDLVRFPVAFRPPALAFWASCTRRGLAPSLPPAYRHPASAWRIPTGLPRSTRTRPDRGGCPSTPRRRCSPGRYDLPGRRLPLPSDQSYPRLPHSIAEAYVTRHHQGFTHVHPSGLPLTCSRRMVRQPLGLNSELHTPPLPVTHVEAGTGIEHSPGTTRSSEPPFRAAVLSSRATSCRTTVS